MSFISIIEIVIGIIGVIVTLFLFVIGKNKKVLEYNILPTELISEENTQIPGLTIKVNDQPIQNLTATVINFKNVGNQIIDTSDFSKKWIAYHNRFRPILQG